MFHRELHSILSLAWDIPKSAYYKVFLSGFSLTLLGSPLSAGLLSPAQVFPRGFPMQWVIPLLHATKILALNRLQKQQLFVLLGRTGFKG